MYFLSGRLISSIFLSISYTLTPSPYRPTTGWILLFNCSKLLTEAYIPVLVFFGKITMKTYVLQFHVFMCENVQHFPIISPESGADGSLILKNGNIFFCGVLVVVLAYWVGKWKLLHK